MTSMSRVEHPVKFSTMSLQERALERVRGRAVWEDNEELLGHLELVKQPKWQVYSLIVVEPVETTRSRSN